MENNLEQKIAEALCEIRYRYIEFNNMVYQLLNNPEELDQPEDKTVDMGLNSKSSNHNRSMVKPILGNATREFIISSINLVNSFTVKKIEDVLEQYIAYLHSMKTGESYNSSGKQRRFSKEVIEGLEASFERDNYPSDQEKVDLARRFKLSLKQVNNWFTNKRNRAKYQRNLNENYNRYF
ncbi:Homeobox protein [Spraguea lophii 42_110]|uniref:Homeobox protein n=1 Tax=Spraguea lophii (strain 42_110) TaxID=1358809 RepID=S7W4H6_SPRLO|nr:Homeobox protein [Spraguea lophii 42_110]